MRPNTSIKEKENGWLYTVPCDPFNTTLDDQMDKLIEIFTPYIKNFLKLPPNLYIAISCVIYDKKNRSPLGFNKKAVAFFSQIGAEIDIDYYDLTKA